MRYAALVFFVFAATTVVFAQTPPSADLAVQKTGPGSVTRSTSMLRQAVRSRAEDTTPANNTGTATTNAVTQVPMLSPAALVLLAGGGRDLHQTLIADSDRVSRGLRLPAHTSGASSLCLYGRALESAHLYKP